MTTSIQQAASESTIVTLTMNPSLDITTSTGVVVPTERMRCSAARYEPGGGGINVARIRADVERLFELAPEPTEIWP